MEDWTFEKSKFREKHIGNGLKDTERTMTNEAFTRTFGQDQITENLKSNAQSLKSDNIFSNLNLVKRQLIPKKRLKQKIAQSYHQAFGNKTIWDTTEGKRADHSKNKLRLQDHLKEEYELLTERRREEKWQYLNYISEDNATVLAERYRRTEEKEALREWAMAESTDTIILNDENMERNQAKVVNNAKDLVSENVEDRLKAYSRILKAVDSIDIDQFAYNTDRDFASNYAKKYELLCKGSAAGVFVDKFLEEGGGTVKGVCIADLQEKIELMKQYKEDYELRMQLLRSPLYALLSAADIKDYQDHREARAAHASQELKNYIELFERLAESPVGKKKDAKALYNAGIQHRRDILSAQYVQKANLEIQDIDNYDGQTGADILKSYDKKPMMGENSVLALFDGALHTNSKQSLEKLREKKNPINKAGSARFFEIFKRKYSAKLKDLPDEGQAQAYNESEEKQINWILQQFVGRDEFSLGEIEKIEKLWDKKQTFDQNNGEPVSEKLKKTVSDIISTWKESINELQVQTEMARTLNRMKKLKKGIGREEQLRIAYNKRNMNRPRITTDRKYWEEKIKGSYDHVLRLESSGTLEALFYKKSTNDAIRQRIIDDPDRQERRNLYMQYSENELEELRKKKTYVISKSEEIHKRNQYGRLYKNSVRDVESVLRDLKPEAYVKIDTIRSEEDPQKRTVDLYHAEGTRLLEEEGHDVIEIDVGGSSYREFSHAQNGFYGYSEGDDYELHKEYGDKYYSNRKKKTMDYIRVKSSSGKSEKAKDRKKYRYTIAGPSPETGGMNNSGDYSIDNTTKYILEIGKKHLEDTFTKWQEEDIAWEKNKEGENPAEKRQKIDFLFRGHSRGGVGSLMGAMKLNYWLHKNYPQYANQVVLHITQYDAVPGKFADWGGYDIVDHAADKHEVWSGKITDYVTGKRKDKEYKPLGSGNVDTTMIYSMNTQYDNFFAAQEVRHAKRLIFTPFNHAVGLDAESTDATQLDQEGEKLHAMTFYDTTSGKAYRQSGLNHLGEGVYIMDEKHNLVKIDSVQEYIRIIQLTIPARDLNEQRIRHMSMLHAVASKFDMTDKEAEKLWNNNMTNPEVLEAAEKWSVYDSENKFQALADMSEMDRDTKKLKQALKDRRTTHTAYIDKNTQKGSVRDFLKVCTEINYYTDYVKYNLFVDGKISEEETNKNMFSFMEQFMKSEKSIDMKALTEEEKLIVDTAGDKVAELLEAMEKVVE